MTESDIHQMVDEAIAMIVEAIDNSDVAIDYESDDDALQIYCENGAELRVAYSEEEAALLLDCDSGSYAFRYDNEMEQWLCDGVDTLRILSRELSECLGETVQLHV